jgi:hypothetical protein
MVDLSRRQACAFVAASAFLPPASFAQGLTPVRVGYVPVIGASALFVTDRMGWAREAGLDLKLVRFDFLMEVSSFLSHLDFLDALFLSLQLLTQRKR